MDEIAKDVTSILVLIVGVATIAVLVQNASGTASVIQAGASGFSTALSTAMGNGGGGFGGSAMGIPGIGG